jgi:hypothetical protein
LEGSLALTQRPLRRRLVGKIRKLEPGEDALPVTVRMPRELLRRIVSIAQSTRNGKTTVINYLLSWAADEYEAEYGKPDQATDDQLVEKRKPDESDRKRAKKR